MNSSVALWRTILPLGRRADMTAPGLQSSCAQKAQARRTQTVKGASGCLWFRGTGLLCTGSILLLPLSTVS